MNGQIRISVKGSCSKSGTTWTAVFPISTVCAEASSAMGCLESIKKTLDVLIEPNPFEYIIEISDDGLLVLSSKETDRFLKFIKSRIVLNGDHESVLAEIDYQNVFFDKRIIIPIPNIKVGRLDVCINGLGLRCFLVINSRLMFDQDIVRSRSNWEVPRSAIQPACSV